MPGLKFTVQQILEASGLKVHETLEPQALGDPDLAAELAGGLSADLEFSVGGSRILLTGQVRGRRRLECARCLEDYDAPFEQTLDETFPLDAASIDAEEEIRQSLFLSAPAKPLCRPDCRGLCPRCGRNLNEGPCNCA